MSDKPVSPDPDSDRPQSPSRRRALESMLVAGAALATGVHAALPPAGRQSASRATRNARLDAALRKRVGHVVVIYCENRSFNNVFADFPGLEQPLSSPPPQRFLQRDRDGSILKRLPPIWHGLVPHKQELDGKAWHIGQDAITGLANAPWKLRSPAGEPLPLALVTSSPVHRFYLNQMQINGGSNDGFVAWGDHGALQMGYYADHASDLRLWRLARDYTLLDNFFMGAFGGSFLAHQYLIAARPPTYPDADRSPARDEIAVLEDGPEGHRLKLADDSPASALDGVPTFASDAQLTPDFHAVNTFGPPYAPSFNTDPKNPLLADLSKKDIIPPQDYPTIGDALSARGVDWAWYGGGWQMALDGKGKHGLSDKFPPSPNFQAHH
ncbi:MAG: acid phosphatase, partial [Rhodanobacteraceae bacterium]